MMQIPKLKGMNAAHTENREAGYCTIHCMLSMSWIVTHQYVELTSSGEAALTILDTPGWRAWKEFRP